MDMFDTLLDWGVDNPLQATLIHTHLEDHEFDEFAQIVFHMEGPDEIPHKVKLLKDEGNRCFKNHDIVNASDYYLSGIKLLCFSCIIFDEDEALFKHLTISLNFNLAASKLRQGKFMSAITLCSLVLEFEPHNTKALCRRAKVALSLHNYHKALCDLREVARLEPHNSEIARELVQVENANCQFEDYNKDLETLEYEVSNVEKPRSFIDKILKTPTDSEVSNVTTNLDVMSIVADISKDFTRHDNSAMETDRASISSCSSSTSVTSVEDRKIIDLITSSVSRSMNVDNLVDIIFHLSTTRNKTRPQRTLQLSPLDYEQITQRREIEFYNSRSIAYMVVRARLSDSNSSAEQHLLKVDQGVESTMEDSPSTATTKGSIVHETNSTCQANDVTSALQFSAQVQRRRHVKPYYFEFICHVKNRWAGKKVVDMFTEEFKGRPHDYYVSLEILFFYRL
ncbi:hypothetical protein Cgig2_014251 [Carnegiea gigantea]|uniref:Uncharacterized protein n=1 Tax=Carnegiea gigantea TaxID=171969 RepID=A0A9Q1K3A6_9CARY|nr:hypothetical protein Cgig2_014251 [Carnegiea gigantea]